MANEKRLIDANAFMAYIEKQYCKPCKKHGQDYNEIRCRACWVDDMSIELDAMPTVDAVVHGRWKYYHKQNIAVCTNCSFERDLDANFGKAISCPNCGAKMDGDGNV